VEGKRRRGKKKPELVKGRKPQEKGVFPFQFVPWKENDVSGEGGSKGGQHIPFPGGGARTGKSVAQWNLETPRHKGRIARPTAGRVETKRKKLKSRLNGVAASQKNGAVGKWPPEKGDGLRKGGGECQGSARLHIEKKKTKFCSLTGGFSAGSGKKESRGGGEG